MSGPSKGAAGGVLVSTAAETLGNRGDIHFALAAQAEADALLGQFAQKDGGLNAGDDSA